MKCFIIDFQPTKAQLTTIGNPDVLEGKFLNQPGKYIVAYDDQKYTKPSWLEDIIELNIVGEKQVCQNCGVEI